MRAVLAWSALLVASSAFADDVHVAKGPLTADDGVTITGRVSVSGPVFEGTLTVSLTRREPHEYQWSGWTFGSR